MMTRNKIMAFSLQTWALNMTTFCSTHFNLLCFDVNEITDPRSPEDTELKA